MENLKHATKAIKSQVYIASNEKISINEMKLIFKINKEGKLVLICCSYLKAFSIEKVNFRRFHHIF